MSNQLIPKKEKAEVLSFKPVQVRSKNRKLFWFIGTICIVAMAIATTAFFGAFAAGALGVTIPNAIAFGFVCFVFVFAFGLYGSN